MRAHLEPGNNFIFISIASYRDRQLVPTVKDLVAKAERPHLLRFGICWQHGSEEPLLPFASDERFQILDYDWRSSQGACWARAEAMTLWRGEDWYFQIDSHCRFAAGWDVKLLEMAASTQSSKPVLSTYGSPFTPADEDHPSSEALCGPPQIITIGRFTPDGIPELRPMVMPNHLERTVPMAARFLAGGFLFAPGHFVVDVPYDPSLYFLGEESSMSVRAFTSGYDLFHPAETIVWHDYERHDAIRHWQDHDATATAPVENSPGWAKLDQQSRAAVQALLTGFESGLELPSEEAPKSFGLGSARTLADFEQYAGLNFRLRRIHDHARLGHEPPSILDGEDWASHVYPWAVRIELNPAALGQGVLHEPGFWMVLIEDEHHQEIFRQDFSDKDLQVFSGNEPRITLICEYEAGLLPAHWIVWPYSSSRGWGLKLTGRFLDDDYAIIRPDSPVEDGHEEQG